MRSAKLATVVRLLNMTSIQPDAGALGTTATAAPGHVEASPGDLATPSTSPDAKIRPGIRALLVDDNPEDRRIAERLSADGLPCHAMAPEGSLDLLRTRILDQASTGQADVVLVDYRLDDRQSDDGPPFAHRAGALAAELKEHRASLPLVLLTTEANLRSWVEGNRSIAPLFDLTVLKSDLAIQASRRHHARGISDLAYGYKQLAILAERGLTWESVASALGLDEGEAATFAADWPDPPPKGLPDLVAAVLKGLMADRPGPLLPYPDAAARLGIMPAALPDVLSAEPRLRYQGPFCLMQPRVWRVRLDAAMARIDAAKGDKAAPDDRFLAAMEQAPVQLCRVCSERRSSRACAVCRQGVDDRHYVLSSELVKPAWSDARAVCFVCIEDGRADEERFPTASRALVERLRSGEGGDADAV
jgi:CheY-like chemotaxis protein